MGFFKIWFVLELLPVLQGADLETEVKVKEMPQNLHIRQLNRPQNTLPSHWMMWKELLTAQYLMEKICRKLLREYSSRLYSTKILYLECKKLYSISCILKRSHYKMYSCIFINLWHVIYCSTDQFDNFLLHLLSYFHCFFDKLHQEHKINTTTYM